MKDWFNGVFELVKNNKLTALYVVIAVVVLILVIIAIIVAVKKKNVYTPSYDDKSEFVHKVMQYDANVTHQLLTAAIVGLLIAAVVLFCTKLVIASAVVACVFVLAFVVKLCVNIRVKFNRVEYKNAEIYKFGFLQKTKVMRWEDVKDVEAKGFGATRKIVLHSKKTTIKIPLSMSGYYDFTVFASKILDGKNFEAIKVAAARR